MKSLIFKRKSFPFALIGALAGGVAAGAVVGFRMAAKPVGKLARAGKAADELIEAARCKAIGIRESVAEVAARSREVADKAPGILRSGLRA